MNVAIIPARGGSRRIHRKNIKQFFGKPIIAYSINTALESKLFDKVIVSTDDAEIADVSQVYGAVPYIRPPNLGGDSVGTQIVMKDCLLFLSELYESPEYACCIYPCAPLVDVDTLKAAYVWLSGSKCDYVVPVGKWLQDPGQFYFGRTEAFLNDRPLLSTSTRILPINENRAIDINTDEDWIAAESMFAKLNNQT